MVPTADEGEAMSDVEEAEEVASIGIETTVVKTRRSDIFYFLDQREKSVNSSIASWERGAEGKSR